MKDKEKRLLICITVLPILFTVALFVLTYVDVRGCDGMFGGLSGECTSTTYLLWGFFSIPFAFISLISGIVKSPLLAKVAAILFMLFNIFLLFFTKAETVLEMETVSILFSGILIYLDNKLIKNKAKKN